MRSEEEVNRAVDRYADAVYRVCMLHLKNRSDTEDIFQEVFLKYALSTVEFEDEVHEKSWILRVTVNACRDLLRSFFRRNTVPLEEAAQAAVQTEGAGEVIEAVLRLPEKYRDPMYLHYYEGYNAEETAMILHKKPNTVYSLWMRGRELLQKELGGPGDGR